ncbi:hypothetical protein IWW54_001670 [Coemansia sp. RSA 2705]|nr:hypothetical protein IWW54_001670 [Coemansia sp. RSA 2705]
MSHDGRHAQQTSAIFRSVWKGSGGLAASRGQLKMDEYSRLLQPLGWRDLGLLLVRLVRPLNDSLPDPDTSEQDAWRWMPWTRSLVALAATIAHMQALTPSDSSLGPAPVNAEFVASTMATMVRSTALVRQHVSAAYPAIVPIVLRAIARVLATTDKVPRFPVDAALNGLCKSSAAASDQPSAKRRRVDAEPAKFLELLASALLDQSLDRAHPYIVRILRARNCALIARHVDNPLLTFRVVRALAGCARDLCDPSTAAASNETHMGNVFACIRDAVSLLPAPSPAELDMPAHVESAAQLALALAKMFRPHIAGSNPPSLYKFCAEKRHRCYQWAALCRVSTWIADSKQAPVVAEALAECSRLCWIQISDTAPADLQIWSLLLSESLGHIALSAGKTVACNSAPLFMQSTDAQSQVFAVLAPLLICITGSLSKLAELKVVRPLVFASLRICERFLRLIRPQSATLGIFRPATHCLDVVRDEGAFRRLECTVSAYVFRPTFIPPASSRQLSANGLPIVQLDLAAELEREESEEIQREAVLGALFKAFIALTNTITADDALLADRGMRSLVALAFRALLRWISAFATSARDNAARQARLLESQQWNNVGMASDKPRTLRLATDWSRLQRVTVVRQPQSAAENAALATHSVYKPILAQAIRLFAALSVWKILGHDSRQVLDSCLVWGDTDTLEPTGDAYSAAQACAFCANLESMLPAQDFASSAFSSLQVLASILGVRSHLFAREIRLLRLPHLEVRSRSPQSSEALMQLAMKTGMCQLLLEPVFLARCIVCVRDGQVISSPLALGAGQIWLDMIGNVVRHSLFRAYVGLSHGANDGGASISPKPNIPFTAWWSLALTASTQCLLMVISASSVSIEHVRLACILPSHLVSWYLYMNISESSAKSFVAAPVSTADLDQALADSQPRLFKSVVSVVYFLACGLWREFPMLQQTYEADDAVLYVCRDVWGIASDSLRMLQQIIRYSAVRKAFVDLGLVGELSTVVCDLIAKQNIPQLVSQVLETYDKPDTPSLTPPEPDDVDPLTSAFLELSEKLDLVTSHRAKPTTDQDGNGDGDMPTDVVEKLLLESAQQRKPVAKQRELSEYYSLDILAHLWTALVNELLTLPVSIAFHPLANKEGCYSYDSLAARQADVLEWLADDDDVLFDTLIPLLAVKEHLASSNWLWKAVESAAPFDVISGPLTTAMSADSAPHMCVSAALVLPELSTADMSCTARRTVTMILECLIGGLKADENYQRCAAALMLMAWRQRTLIDRHIRESVVCLQLAVSQVLASTASSRPLVARLDDSTGADLILLSGSGMGTDDQPIRTSLTLLTRHSSVFDAMFAGDFSETSAVRSGVQHFRLHDNHEALAGLVAILHKCTIVSDFARADCRLLRGEIRAEYELPAIVRILALAIFYDARPAIVLLSWYLCELADDIHALPDDSLALLATMFTENWRLYLPSVDCAQAVSRLLAALLLFHVDRIDIVDATEANPELFAAAATHIFQTDSV